MTKFLLDYQSCLNGYRVLYSKSNFEFYTLLSIKTQISIPKGRRSPSLVAGAREFLKSDIQLIFDPFIPSINNKGLELIEFLAKNISKKELYTIVTDDTDKISFCKKHQIPWIRLVDLEKKVVFDKEAYKKILNEINTEIKDFSDLILFSNLIAVLIIIASFFAILYSKEIIDFLSLTLIIPVSVVISAILYKVKKSFLLIYTLLEFVVGLILVYIVFNYYKNDEMESFFKLFALMSAIFICVRSFSNFDTYASKKNNKITSLWKKVYR